jgi:hypothetical protein
MKHTTPETASPSIKKKETKREERTNANPLTKHLPASVALA